MNRRQFLATTAGAVAATRLAAADEPKGQPDVLPIIDTHQHLWDLKQFRLPWIKPDAPLARSFLMDDYLAATAGLNVVKTVYMEVDVDPEQQRAEADYVIDLCKRADNPMVAAVISGRPASGAFPRSITPFKDSAYVKGVRQVLHGPDTPAGYCLSAEFIRGVRLLGELGLSFDVCVRPGAVGDAVKLVDACPDTRFILDHCGNGEVKAKDRTQWKKDM